MKIWKNCWNNNRKKRKILLIAGLVLLALAVVLSLCLGSAGLSPRQLFDAVFHPEQAGNAAAILQYSRLPRILAALFAGAGLAAAGAVLQSVLANPLASANIIGVNAGAGLAVTACGALGLAAGWQISLAAFLGSLAAVGLICLLAWRTGASRSTVILGGVALNSMLNAASEALASLDPDVAALNADFRVGGFSSVAYPRLIPAMCMVGVGLLTLFLLANELDVLRMGDETARGVGLNVKVYRVVFMALAALLAGACVSVAGLMGFVGLIVPHFVRKLAGSDSRWLLPLSAVYGGLLTAVCDLVARTAFAPFELPVGIIMAVIGGPLFVVVLVRSRGGHGHG